VRRLWVAPGEGGDWRLGWCRNAGTSKPCPVALLVDVTRGPTWREGHDRCQICLNRRVCSRWSGERNKCKVSEIGWRQQAPIIVLISSCGLDYA